MPRLTRLRIPLAFALALALTSGGCSSTTPRSPRPTGISEVPAEPPQGEGFEVVGGDLVIDDTLGVHVVFALGRPGGPPAQVQYARGQAGGDSVVWEGARVLLPEGGERPRFALADSILHLFAGERLRHLASTNGGRGWHDLATMIAPDSSWSTDFAVTARGGAVFVASVERPSLPDDGAMRPGVGRLELRVHAWRMGNRVESRLLTAWPDDGAYELAPAIAVVDSGVEVSGTAFAEAGIGTVRWRSDDDGVTWSRSGAEAAPPDSAATKEGPDVLARRFARARSFTLRSRRGVPRAYLEIRPTGTFRRIPNGDPGS